jgi:phosphatidylglycerol---prolipoprotein diacylglyceryl transferase
MHPILLKVNSFNVYSYGFMVALGFAVSVFLMCASAGRFNLNKDRVIDLSILVLVTGVIGARLLYVVLNLKYYIANPLEIIQLSKGGLVWYGGFLAALAAMVIYARRKGLGFLRAADFFVPYLALAQVFGRIGCFLNGCCYGIEAPSGYPLAVIFPYDTISRHSTQIYAAFALIIIYIILRLWQERPHFTGEIFLAYCMLYSGKRFLIEFVRGDNPRVVLGLTLSQALSVAVFLVSLFIFIKKISEWNQSNTT